MQATTDIHPRSSDAAVAALTRLPIVLLLALLVWNMVTGHSPVDAAGAVTDVDVTGSNAAEVSIDTAACLPPAMAIGDIVPGTDPWKTAQDNGGSTCTIAFGTTNISQGVNLSVLEDPGAPPAPADAMKCTSASCAGDALGDFNGPGEPAAGTSAFGTQLLAAGGIASTAWSVAPAVHAVADVGQTACQTAAVGTGTCEFTFGATAAVGDGPGAYEAQVRYLVGAR